MPSRPLKITLKTRILRAYMKRLTTEEYSEKLSKYIKDTDKIYVKHKSCGGINYVTAGSLIQTASCKSCQPERMRNISAWSHKEYIEKVFKEVGNEYSILDKYINANTKIRIKHNNCNRVWFAQARSIFLGRRCPQCYWDSIRCKNPEAKNKAYNTQSAVWGFMKRGGKSQWVANLLGVENSDEFRDYIESKFSYGMNWDNYGEWELDHIRPIASFNILEDKEYKKCFHYTNYQPLWKEHNRSKKSFYEGEAHYST